MGDSNKLNLMVAVLVFNFCMILSIFVYNNDWSAEAPIYSRFFYSALVSLAPAIVAYVAMKMINK